MTARATSGSRPGGGRLYGDNDPDWTWDDYDACGTYSDVDSIFGLAVTSRSVYVISSADSWFDTVLGLYHRATGGGYSGCVGSEIACDDDGGPGDTSLIVQLLEVGDYTIVVEGGDYTWYEWYIDVRRFEFSDGSEHLWANWNSGEPNNRDEDCAEMYQSSGYWNDAECSGTRPYVCKMPN